MNFSNIDSLIDKARPKIIVGLSGGVDSSVTAYTLQQAGYQVEGLFMKNWQDDDENCPAAADLLDAQRVCDVLGIELHTVSFAQEYWHHVFEHFLAEYQVGRTPNPDILCNKEIKFKAFLDYARTLGADYIATGHYAGIQRTPCGNYLLMCAQDNNKDQTYFLYTLGQAQLRQSLFPLNEIDKSEVRKIAEKAGLTTHNKKDSTGICFIGERRFQTFLSQYLPMKPGEIHTLSGDVIGQHNGVIYYTRGQRQGLQIGGLKNYPEKPWFVADKDVEKNILYAVQGHDHPALFHQQLRCHHCHWVWDSPKPGQRLTAKIRYRHAAEPCEIQVDECDNDILHVKFKRPQWAITPGQAIVFYEADVCLGGATITEYA